MWCMMILDFYIVFIFIMRKVSLDQSFSADDVLSETTVTTTKILFTLYRIEFITVMNSISEKAIYRDNTSFHYFWLLWCWILFCDSYTNAHNSSMFWKEENGGHVNFAERKYFIQYDVEYIKNIDAESNVDV